MTQNDEQTEMEQLQQDLLAMSPMEFYMKYIVKTRNWYFAKHFNMSTEDMMEKLDSFKEIVSSKLNISFHSVQIVGSAKIGYSLAPNNLLRPFHDADENGHSSDIDIAIISERLFQQYWDKLRKVKGIWYKAYYEKLAKSIYNGYIDGFYLAMIDGIREEWTKMTGPANKELQFQLGIIHPITYRVYRYWDDLQEYQLTGIRKAKSTLGGN